MKEGEEPNDISINLENVIIFQKAKNAPKLFTVHERKGNGIKRISLWDGNYFVDNNNKKQETLIRNFEGETLRVGSGPMMPGAFIITLPNGKQVVGGGYNHAILRMISDIDKLTLKIDGSSLKFLFSKIE